MERPRSGELTGSRRGIRSVRSTDAEYPERLRALVDPPPVLFFRGRMDLLDRPAVAVVGSRRATPVGRRAAERIGRDLSEAGVTVVSGMALGIDGAAHRGALHGVGSTIAVLGRGPDRAYPQANRAIFGRIVLEGLVVSEFAPGVAARPYHFPRRNRVLAALARAVVVVEAATRSGALLTVGHALDLGLEVFAMPGSVEAEQSAGTNLLLREGAHPLIDARDVLETMGWAPPPVSPEVRDATAGPPTAPDGTAGPPTDRRRVLGGLGPAPRSLDDLVESARLPPARVLSILTALELEGSARRGLDGWTSVSTPLPPRRTTEDRSGGPDFRNLRDWAG